MAAPSAYSFSTSGSFPMQLIPEVRDMTVLVQSLLSEMLLGVKAQLAEDSNVAALSGTIWINTDPSKIVWKHTVFEKGSLCAISCNSKVPAASRDYVIPSVSPSVPATQRQQPGYGWLLGQTQSDNHTEPKLLVQLQMELKGHSNHTLAGCILIGSSRDVCGGCQKIIRQFTAAFPHIQVYAVGLGQGGAATVTLVKDESAVDFLTNPSARNDSAQVLRFSNGNMSSY